MSEPGSLEAPATTDTATLRIGPRSIVASVLLVAALLVVFEVASRATTTLWWFAQAAVFAMLATPVVRRMERRVPAAVAVLLITVAVAAVVAGVAAGGVLELRSESAALRDAVPAAVDRLESAEGIGELARRLDLRRVLESFAEATERRFSISGDVGGVAGRVGGAASATFVVWILTVMLVLTGPSMLRGATGLIPEHRRSAVEALVRSATARAVGHIGLAAGRATVVGVLTYLTARLLGLEMAGVLALVAVLVGFLPFVGVLCAGILTGSLALVAGPTQAVVVLVGAAAIQTFDSIVVQPRIDARTMPIGLFPTLAAAMIGFSLHGPGGLLVGVTAVAVAVALVRDLARS